MGNLTLKFLQEIHSLESDVDIILKCTESPEECPELFNILINSIKTKISNIVGHLIQFVLIGNSVHVSVGEGDDKKTMTGLPVVADLMVEVIVKSILNVALSKSQNLALSRDILKQLGITEEGADKVCPSGKITNLLLTLDNMETQLSKSLEKK